MLSSEIVPLVWISIHPIKIVIQFVCLFVDLFCCILGVKWAALQAYIRVLLCAVYTRVLHIYLLRACSWRINWMKRSGWYCMHFRFGTYWIYNNNSDIGLMRITAMHSKKLKEIRMEVFWLQSYSIHVLAWVQLGNISLILRKWQSGSRNSTVSLISLGFLRFYRKPRMRTV